MTSIRAGRNRLGGAQRPTELRLISSANGMLISVNRTQEATKTNSKVSKRKAIQTPSWKSEAPLQTVRALLLLGVIVVASAWTLTPASAQSLSAGEGNLRVMTYNLYEGAELSVALGSQTFPEFLAAVTTILNNVKASNPPERAAAVAGRIRKARSTLVGSARNEKVITSAIFLDCRSQSPVHPK